MRHDERVIPCTTFKLFIPISQQYTSSWIRRGPSNFPASTTIEASPRAESRPLITLGKRRFVEVYTFKSEVRISDYYERDGGLHPTTTRRGGETLGRNEWYTLCERLLVIRQYVREEGTERSSIPSLSVMGDTSLSHSHHPIMIDIRSKRFTMDEC